MCKFHTHIISGVYMYKKAYKGTHAYISEVTIWLGRWEQYRLGFCLLISYVISGNIYLEENPSNGGGYQQCHYLSSPYKWYEAFWLNKKMDNVSVSSYLLLRQRIIVKHITLKKSNLLSIQRNLAQWQKM